MKLTRVVGALTLLMLVAVGTTAPPPLTAQTGGTITGTVVAAGTLQPLPGAQVVVDGTGRGGVTTSTGAFAITNVPAGTHTLRSSVIGYTAVSQQVTVAAGQTTTVNLALSQSVLALDALVVTGTPGGASQRRQIGNTVSTVSAAEIAELAAPSDVQELLGARVPGLTLMSSSGMAGASSKIRIRGAGSLSGGNEPVIFVDGVRFEAGTAGGYGVSGGTVQGTNPLDAINPNDIESIEVIKGPAAATLYGAEAANGVIQIITKKGSGSGGIQFSGGFELGQTDWHLERPVNYWTCTPANISNAAGWPGCQGLDPDAPAAERLIEYRPFDVDLDCRWTENCQPNAIRVGGVGGFNLSARGGTQDYNYFISGERSSEEGVYYNNSAERTSARGNFGFRPTDELDFAVNVAYVQNDVAMSESDNSSNSVLRNGYRGVPGQAGSWEDGWLGFSPEISNQFDNRIMSERTTLGITANYKPVSWFANRLIFGLDSNDRINQQFNRIDETGRAPWGAIAATGRIQRLMPNARFWTLDYSGSLINPIGDDYVSTFSGGMQYSARSTETHEVIGEGLVANSLNLVNAAQVRRGGQSISSQNSLGFFVQEQVGWRDRLFVTGALRVDDNSAFGEDFSLVYYPKASVSWVVSEEDFFQLPVVDNLRLRGAWGRAGNAPAPSRPTARSERRARPWTISRSTGWSRPSTAIPI